MSVSKICSRCVDTILANETAANAAERMRQRAVGCLVVVDSGQWPIGIVTDRDLVLRVVAPGLDSKQTMVSAIMTPKPKVTRSDLSIESALGEMRQGGFRRLPVVDNHGRLCGLVTLDDVLMLLAEEITQIGDLIGSETPEATLTGG